MGAKIFKNLLVILSFTALTAPWLAVIAVAKPLEPLPDWEHWAAGTLWGTELSLENAYSKVYFGAKTGAEHVYLLSPAPPSPWIKLSLVQGGTEYGEITRTQGTPPQSYSWYVMIQSSTAQTGLTLSADLESDNYWFVPQDHSVVLENATAGIGPWNLREENGSINLSAWVPKYATLYVDNHVNLTISPDSQSGDYGDNVSFTVTVSNTGGYNDTYSLDVDAGGWSYDISPSSLSINAGDNGIATLTVTLGTGANDITVTADGFYADDNCTASAFGMPVSISISPSEKSALPDENVDFAVTIKNLGENVDNYALEVNDNLGWNPTLDDNFFENVVPGENRTTTLTVMISENVEFGAEDDLIVIVTSQAYPWASDNATCIARAGFYGVEVSILQGYQENAPGGRLNYTVMVSNTGDLYDSYAVTFMDNINGDTYWEENISLDNSLLAVPAGENRTTTLRVTIPDNAPPGTQANITVIATSQADNAVENSASCIAHVARLSVSILPGYQSRLPGEELIYIVKIVNNENTEGDYYSVVTDNFGWELMFGIKRIILYPFGEAWTILKVTIPENAIGCTEDTVTVTMVSVDNTISYSASCIAHATIVRGVEVSITPHEKSGPPGATLEYTIKVKNTGNVEDNYDLTANDDAGWDIELSPPSLTIPPRSFENATLRVTIPENAEPKITDNITVTATSQADPLISAENICIALSLAKFELGLLLGWNLVSFPVASENDTPANLFAGQTYYTWKWDPIQQKYVSPFPDEPVELGVGYWVYVEENMTAATSGIPVENYSIDLITGWNLVGFPVTNENTTPDNIFAGETYYIWKWDVIAKKYVSPFSDVPVELGVGYWIWVDHDKTVTVPL